MSSKVQRLMLLTLAGLVSAVLTYWGLMAFAFSGTASENRIAVTLFWAVPLLSLPAVGVHIFWSKMPTAIFWALLICEWVSVSWLNWDSCLRRGCTTSNPLLITLSGAIAFPVWCWIAIACLCQYEHHIRTKRSVVEKTLTAELEP